MIYFEPWKSVGGIREAHANIFKGRRNKLKLIMIRSAAARVNGKRGGWEGQRRAREMTQIETCSMDGTRERSRETGGKGGWGGMKEKESKGGRQGGRTCERKHNNRT